jgi:hypothetical protein
MLDGVRHLSSLLIEELFNHQQVLCRPNNTLLNVQDPVAEIGVVTRLRTRLVVPRLDTLESYCGLVHVCHGRYPVTEP